MVKADGLSWEEQCRNLLSILKQSGDSVSFRAPVNFEVVPDYLRVVDYPMDLQTVGERLQDGHYATPSEFAKDVRLIFVNSKKFSSNKESLIYKMTDRLSLLFEDYFRHIQWNSKLNYLIEKKYRITETVMHFCATFYETQKSAAGCKSKWRDLHWFKLKICFLPVVTKCELFLKDAQQVVFRLLTVDSLFSHFPFSWSFPFVLYFSLPIRQLP